MIKIENIDVYGWEPAIRGMRNPLNSWEKSDSGAAVNCAECGLIEERGICKKADRVGRCENFEYYYIGENDLKLMQQLSATGNDHAKFLRMIVVTMDITAPLYWWAEYDTYKVGTVANSCSKMHKLLCKPFEMSDFSFDKLPGYKNEIKQFRPEIDEETEIWRKFDVDYDVSNQGRIRRGSRILSGSLHKDGYISVTIHGKQYPLHRLIALKWCNGFSNKKEINHKDGNKQNNFANNLEWVTRRENQQHAVNTGLQPKSTSTYKGKFTPEQRLEIKGEWDNGKYSRRELAKKYGVSHTCINDIINDKYKYAETVNLYKDVAKPWVDTLNELRDAWFECDNEEDKKRIWYAIIQLLPESYNQKRTVLLNYQVLKNMYFARRKHKLDEWRTFCEEVEKLPYFKEICIEPME